MDSPHLDPGRLDATLSRQNPWHAEGLVPPHLTPRGERPLGRHLWRRLEVDRPRRFQVVLGARRVGKTTAMLQTVRHLIDRGAPVRRVWWAHLDDPVLRDVPLDVLVRRVINRADGSHERPVVLFLDEVVYAPRWEEWLKTIYDEHWPVRIVAGASASVEFLRRLPEAGVGRFEEQHLGPCLLPEALDLFGKGPEVELARTLGESLELVARHGIGPGAPDALGLLARERRALLIGGGFPEILRERAERQLDDDDLVYFSQARLLTETLMLAVYRDIVQAFGVEDPPLLERLLYVLAGQIGGILSPQSISRDIERLSESTFERYLSYLERSYLVFTLPNYSGSEAKVQRRGRKVYFVDGAVRNAILRRGDAVLQHGTDLGPLTENLCAAHLATFARQEGLRLHHWREGRDEVDFVLDDPRRPLAVEVGLSAGHGRQGLREICARHPSFQGGAWLVAPDAPNVPPALAGDGIGTISLDLFLLTVGRQWEAAVRRRLGY